MGPGRMGRYMRSGQMGSGRRSGRYMLLFSLTRWPAGLARCSGIIPSNYQRSPPNPVCHLLSDKLGWI